MFLRPVLALCLAAGCFTAVSAQPPVIPPASDVKPAGGPQFPDAPPAPAPKPIPKPVDVDPAPAPAPKPADAPVLVRAGQYYVFKSDVELFSKQVGTGALELTTRKSGYVLPADKVVNWPADADNPEVVTFTAPFVYVGKVAKEGTVTLVVVPKGVEDAEKIYVKPLVLGKAPAPVDPPVDPAVDPLVTALAAGYKLDAEPNKAQLLASLADVMGGSVAAARASGRVQTDKQLVDAVHAATDLAVGAGKLKNTRKAVGVYLNAALPKNGGLMTDELWAKEAAEYAKVSAALKEVVK